MCDQYGIRQKTDYIIYDNAATMREAFSVCFMCYDENETSSASADESNDNSGNEDVDDDDLWEDLSENDQTVKDL